MHKSFFSSHKVVVVASLNFEGFITVFYSAIDMEGVTVEYKGNGNVDSLFFLKIFKGKFWWLKLHFSKKLLEIFE